MNLKLVKAKNSKSNGRFAKYGFQIVAKVISDLECDSLAAELSALFESQQNLAKSKIGGVRNLLRNPRVVSFASSSNLLSLLNELTGEKLFPVRAIFFDKTPGSNWRVPWHQDLAIAVAERIETPGFTGWSVKNGVPHVHPPRRILEDMVTVRLHLDECNLNNGALKVISNSHLKGKLDAARIAELSQNKIFICEIPKGGVLLMRPLLLHSSSPAKNPLHRRVLHIEYAASQLPNGLRWFER